MTTQILKFYLDFGRNCFKNFPNYNNSSLVKRKKKNLFKPLQTHFKQFICHSSSSPFKSNSKPFEINLNFLT